MLTGLSGGWLNSESFRFSTTHSPANNTRPLPREPASSTNSRKPATLLAITARRHLRGSGFWGCVTAEGELVFGYRRLLACREQLGWSEIDTRTVDVSSIVAGEYAENEIRKAFTLSERVAIMKVIEKKIGNRQGQRTDQLPNNCWEVAKGKETKGIAAKRAGFGSGKTGQRAELAVEQAGSELAELMDKGEPPPIRSRGCKKTVGGGDVRRIVPKAINKTDRWRPGLNCFPR